MSPNPLKNFPSVNELLDNPQLQGLVDRINRSTIVGTVRTVLDEVRTEVQSAASEKTLPSVSELADRIARRVMQSHRACLRPSINATGMLLHPDLGSPPLADEAIEAIHAAAITARNYSQVDSESGKTDPQQSPPGVEPLLQEITGAEAALVVQGTAHAMMLVLSSIAEDVDHGEVIVSRGRLGRIEGEPGLTQIAATVGVGIREVGTTNRTELDDYRRAVDASTVALMLPHPTDFALVGRTVDATLDELVDLGRRHELPVIHDVGSGGVLDLSPQGLSSEPVVGESLRTGADLVLFRGDRLLGGPACGLLVGKKKWIQQIRRHPMAEALCANRWTQAALEATLMLYHESEEARRQIPLLSLLHTSVENLKNRAERLAPQLAAIEGVASANPIETVAYLSHAKLPAQELSSWAIAVTAEENRLDDLVSAMRCGNPMVACHANGDRLFLDLRGVIARQDQDLMRTLTDFGKTTQNPP